MTTATNANDIVIHADIPLDSIVRGSIVRTGPEYDTYVEAASVLHVVLDYAAHLLVDKIAREDREFRDDLRTMINAKFEAQLQDRVNEAIEAKTRPARGWGEPEADPVPLEDYIATKVEEWLKSPTDTYSRTSRLDKAVSEFMSSATERALKEAMSEARKQALDAFTKVAEAKLADALRESLAAVARS